MPTNPNINPPTTARTSTTIVGNRLPVYFRNRLRDEWTR